MQQLRPVAPQAPRRWPTGLVVAFALLVVAGGALSFGFLRKGGNIFGRSINIDPWTLPEASVPPLAFAARWISVPLASPSGAVYGVIDGGATPAVVAIDGATGALRWKTPIAANAPLADYRHADGWNRNGANVATEFQPVVPLLGVVGGTLTVAFDHDWAFFDVATGVLRKSGRIPTSLPAVNPSGGLCPIGRDVWIAMADGRDGGLRITEAGTTDGLRLDRPADCKPPIGTLGEPYGHRTSPLQQARGNRIPKVCMRTRAKSHTESNSCKLWGETPGGVAFGADYTDVFLDGKSFSFRKPSDAFPTFSLLGIEAAGGSLFVTMSESAERTTETRPPPGSFAPVERRSAFQYRMVLVAVDDKRNARWTTTIGTEPDSWGSPLVVAADRAAATQNLYLFTPGKLVALDQATGQAKFRINAN
jgi:hypothetical protein